MENKKTISLVTLLIAMVSLLVLTFIFIQHYVMIGLESGQDTLFALLTKIDYIYLMPTFLSVFASMLLFDTLIILIRYVWRDVQNKAIQSFHWNVKNYWRKHRTIHLTFILLTLFLTIAIMAPAKIMNTFTAIVSISVLVSNLTKE